MPVFNYSIAKVKVEKGQKDGLGGGGKWIMKEDLQVFYGDKFKGTFIFLENLFWDYFPWFKKLLF